MKILAYKTNYIDILFFTWPVIGRQNNTVKFGVPWFFGCSGFPILRCSGMFRCSYEVLVHAQ